jgi:transcriptional regulator with XRE-family HTH domain
MHRRMKSRRLTNEALGHDLGHADGSRVGHYRRGRNEPSFEDLQGICAALGCSLDWLIRGHGDPEGEGELAFEAQFARFRAALARGEDPITVWEQVLERPLTDAERQIVGADPEGLRRYLAAHPIAAWELLDPEARAAVGRVVELLATGRRGFRRGEPETSP